MKTEVNINTDMLTWAIDRAGYDVQQFSSKLPKIIDWINGTKKPTVKQLEDFAKKVYLPFGYLFLQTPPKEEIPIPYFRSIGSNVEKVSINIYDTIQLLLKRQSWLRDYLKDNDFEQLDFVGASKNVNEVDFIVDSIRAKLGLEKNWAIQHKTWEDALNYLVRLIEDIGIITVFNGVVDNNNRRQLSVEECRGFVIVDNYAPFMFVNNSDAKSAQMFTIVHELAHVWIGKSAGFDFRMLQPANDPIEKLCDQVAAEFLVPESSFIEVWKSFEEIKNYSKHFKVSEIVIARRALDLGKISKSEFFDFYEEYLKKEFKRNNNRRTGGNFYATTNKRLSSTFVHHIDRAVKSGALLYRDAYNLTSMKGDTFNKFFNKYVNN